METPYYKKINPIVIKLGGTEFLHYTGFSVRRSLSQFVDTFSLSCSNPAGRYSREIYTGMSFQAYFEGVEILRGLIEGKKSRSAAVGSNITFTGREELVDVTEDDVDPSMGPFENVTDNTIIEALIDGFGWSTDFDDAKVITKYDITPGSSRKGQIIVDVARRNNFYVWKKGVVIYKRTLPEAGGDIKDKFEFAVGLNSRGKWTNRVTSVDIVEDVSGAKSKLIGSGYEEGKPKEGTTVEVENDTIKDGKYHTVIRNLLSQTNTRPLSRTHYASLPTTDEVSTNVLVERAVKEMNISAYINITLAGFHDFDLTDTVLFDAESEGIYNTFYVSTIEYRFESNNKRTTQLTLCPISYLPV